MYFIFADDSKQKMPSRDRMGPLVSIGGFIIPDKYVKFAEKSINKICLDFGFPTNTTVNEFKWSPGKELWMRKNLIGKERLNFFSQIISVLEKSKIRIIVIIEDLYCKPATDETDHEKDSAILFIERVQMFLNNNRSEGLIITDRPGGRRKDEDSFLSTCLETLQFGTNYIKPNNLLINVLSSPSKFVRLIQAADLITGSILSYVSGEQKYSPKIFKKLRNLFYSNNNRIGGIGLKLHPDLKYLNLYYWLLDDKFYLRSTPNKRFNLPSKNFPYYKSPNIFDTLPMH